MKLRLAITGSSGYLAQQLIYRLASDGDVEFILGLDIRPGRAEVACPALFLRYDLTAPWEELRDCFSSHRINAALHLAWQFNPIHDEKRHRQMDVEASRNFFCAAEGAAVGRVVYTSSATAYTNAANTETPLPEQTPVTGTPRYLYSKHKGEVDRMAQEFMHQHPRVQVIILRPAIILGPNTQNIVSKMTEWPSRLFPWMFQVRGADPPMQFLSEDDIGEILYRAVKSELTGIFNCAGNGVVRLTELARVLGKEPLLIPARLLYGLAELQWKLHLAPFPSGILDMIRYPWVVDTTRLKTVFGFEPRLSSREALESYAAARRR
jgi:UDP-glucose 4-epimerase